MSESISTGPISAAQSYLIGNSTQKIEPGLYIVATPIGNLRDISLRALDILSAADMVLAEDTRQSRKLFEAYKLTTPLSAYHDHNVAERLPAILSELEAGKTIAQISDAGTPLISDPGYKLVRAAIEAGHKVYPVPGASSVMAGLMSAGLPTDRFLFAGFLPSKKTARRETLKEFAGLRATLIFFESAKRLSAALEDVLGALGDRPAVIAREMTKRYEQIYRGHVSVLREIVQVETLRGEIVLLIGPAKAGKKWDMAQIDQALLNCLSDMGVKQASQHVAVLSQWPKREIYQRALALKSSSKTP